MDYEKKYKEALARATKLHSEPTGGTERIVCEQIFPELMVSEDEKIRKVLIDYFKRYKEQEECGIKTFYGIPADDILAWLEKQGTQPRYNIGDVICDKLCTTLNKEAQPNMEIVDIKNGMYICDKGTFPVSQQGEYELVSKRIDTKLNDDSVSNELREASIKHAENELKNQTFHDNLEFELIYTFEEGAKWNAAQKSTWSEKYIADVFEKVGLAKIAREQSNDALTIALQDAMIELSKFTLQPNPTAWSEEDKKMLYNVIHRIEQLDHYWNKPSDEKMINWLKSLRPQSQWKPSDAQMIALNDVITNGHLPNVNQKILKGLQKQLRKLKGE